MDKISPKKALELSKSLDKFSYFANPFYLVAGCGWEERNGEELVFEKDVASDQMLLMFLPKNKANMAGQRVTTAYDEDLAAIEKEGLKVIEKKLIGMEFIYRTEDFIRMKGSQWRSFRKDVNGFQKKHKFDVLHDYPKERIISFMRSWESKKDLSGKSDLTKTLFEWDFKYCLDYLDMLPKIPHKKIFIEINGTLEGFAIFLPMRMDLWVALMQKANNDFRGLSKFLYHLKAREMQGAEFFTTGAEAQDPKLAEFKESIHPVKKLPIYDISISEY